MARKLVLYLLQSNKGQSKCKTYFRCAQGISKEIITGTDKNSE